MPGYPIELNVRGKTAVVVGLGLVGQRKAAGLLAAGARVVAIDPDPAQGVPDGVELRAEPYRAEHLNGASLVLAAASAEVNRKVVADAQAAGILVNSASDPDDGDFALPAIWRAGLVTVAVSTSGASPALAATLRDRAATALGTAAVELAALLAELRPEVIARVTDPDRRRALLASWGDPRWLELCQTEGIEAARRRLVEQIVGQGDA